MKPLRALEVAHVHVKLDEGRKRPGVLGILRQDGGIELGAAADVAGRHETVGLREKLVGGAGPERDPRGAR